MKEFYQFEEYAREHEREISYDIISGVRDNIKPGVTLTQADSDLITQISLKSCFALLRAYHAWANEDP